MPSISEVLQALGNDGATANARRTLDARDHEAWLVSNLTHRLDLLDLAAASVVAAKPAIAAA